MQAISGSQEGGESRTSKEASQMQSRRMSGRALRLLDFEQTLEWLAAFTSTAVGREAVMALKPASDESTVRRRLAATEEAMRFLEGRGGWEFPVLPEMRSALVRLGVDAAILSATELAQVGALLAATKAVRASLSPDPGNFPEMAALHTRLLTHPDLEAAIRGAMDLSGDVLDTASPELGRIRARLAGAHKRVVSHLESLLAQISDRHRVADASVTIREGRYVIPIRREGRRKLGGYVHDLSATGATIFVEPPSAIEMMNEVRELERAEMHEVQRILHSLSERCRPLAARLEESEKALAELDKRIALARAGSRWNGTVPEPGDELVIRQGRHPLLAARGEPVPFDLELSSTEGVVVVTGPNAGGKTVFLKSVGLISALAQCGVVPPVGPGTRLPVFFTIFADIGDEQSIANSLSTFSAHLYNLKEIAECADERSLVLIDEPGMGTDPKEGEALAMTIVERLAELGCRAVVTSHLGRLKKLAAPESRIVNASLRFDDERMAPTFDFVKGCPGRSYGLVIARGLGFPQELLARAERYRDRVDMRIDALLENLEKKEQRAERLTEELKQERQRVDSRAAKLVAREEVIRRAERDHDAVTRAQARRLLLDARAEVDAAIARLSAELHAGAPARVAARTARRRIEDAARALEVLPVDSSDVPRQPAATLAPGASLIPGATVQMADSRTCGTLVALNGDRAVVKVGALRMKVPAGLLVAVQGDVDARGAR